MPALSTSIFRLRNLAAFLITLSGVGQVAMLWFRELNGDAVVDAVIGFTYIIIGIGLQGQSRFTLFVAIAVPAAAAAYVMENIANNGPGSLQVTRLVLDLLVVICSTVVLANTRK